MKFSIDTSTPPTKTLKEMRDEFNKLPGFTKDELKLVSSRMTKLSEAIKQKLEKANEITTNRTSRLY